MKRVKVYHYDAFSHIPNMGNPAGVVLDAESLTEEQMQAVAEKVGFNRQLFRSNPIRLISASASSRQGMR